MWSPTYSSDELYHHGILKMKWGVRNGPPYPLQPSQHSAAEKRAMGKKAKKTGDSSGEGKAKRKFSLSEEQKSKLKKAAIGAAVVGGVALGAYTAYKLNGPEFKAMVNAAKSSNGVNSIMKTMSSTKVSNLSTKSKGDSLSDLYDKFKDNPNVKVYKNGLEMGRDNLKSANRGLEAANKIIENSKNMAGSVSKEGTLKSVQLRKQMETERQIKQQAFEQYAKGVKAKKELDAWKASKKYDDLLLGKRPEASISEQKFVEAAKAREAAKAVNTTAKKTTATATKATTAKPKLEFGGPSSSSSSDTMERLLKNNKTLSDIAKSSASNSNWATEYDSYTRHLLNKNGGMLKNMTMDDLKKLDLY